MVIVGKLIIIIFKYPGMSSQRPELDSSNQNEKKGHMPKVLYKKKGCICCLLE